MSKIASPKIRNTVDNFSQTFAGVVNFLKALLCNIKRHIIDILRTTEGGNRLYFFIRRNIGFRTDVDYGFPNLISMELASRCNLSCIHCPSHSGGSERPPREFGFLDSSLFECLMDEIDQFGPRKIMLHKDGEPLLNPKYPEMLTRLKRNREHHVYLSTNGTLLDEDAVRRIIDSRINHVNVSIGASSGKMYRLIRGGDIEAVKSNVLDLLSQIGRSAWKPKVSVQIIKLDLDGMKMEVSEFARFWRSHRVAVWVWDELTWGLKHPAVQPGYRYPCYSLWDSFNINSDGNVSACCMDWNQSLLIGNIKQTPIKSVWQGSPLREYRKQHIVNDYHEMALCQRCNYWHWQPMLVKYTC